MWLQADDSRSMEFALGPVLFCHPNGRKDARQRSKSEGSDGVPAALLRQADEGLFPHELSLFMSES